MYTICTNQINSKVIWVETELFMWSLISLLVRSEAGNPCRSTFYQTPRFSYVKDNSSACNIMKYCMFITISSRLLDLQSFVSFFVNEGKRCNALLFCAEFERTAQTERRQLQAGCWNVKGTAGSASVLQCSVTADLISAILYVFYQVAGWKW